MEKLTAGAFKRIFAAFLAVSAFSSLNALTVEDVLGKDKAEALEKSGKLSTMNYRKDSVNLEYIPHANLTSWVQNIWPEGAEAPAMVIENCYLLDKNELTKGNPEKANIDEISKLVRSTNKMEGMKYFSSSKKWEVLYHDCYRIAGPNDRTRLEDDVSGSADGKVMYCMQNDNSFGKTNYRLEYHQDEDEVCASFVNATSVSVGPIKAVEPGNLRIGMHFIDCGDKLLVYLLTEAKFPAISILEKKMNQTFSSRLDAVYNWFISQF